MKQWDAFIYEISKSVKTKQMSDDLHSTFVMFMYSIYKKIIYYLLWILTESVKFVHTSLPLPNLE